MTERSVASRPGVLLAADALRAATSGLAATVPMSAVMLGLHQAFPDERKRPLPPEIVTRKATRPTGLPEVMGPTGYRLLTVAGHFGYGAAAGALYTLWERTVPAPPVLNGALFGLAVWSGSYLGWIPSVGLMRPATRHPWERNLMMIAAHLVWGAALGLAFDRSRRAGRGLRPAQPLEPKSREIAPL